MLTPPSLLARNANPTEQKNELMLSESIFGVDVTIVPIQPREDFSISFAQLPLIATETYSVFSPSSSGARGEILTGFEIDPEQNKKFKIVFSPRTQQGAEEEKWIIR